MSEDTVYFHIKPGTPAAELCAELEECIQSFDAATDELGEYFKGLFSTKKTMSFLYRSDYTPVGFKFDGYKEAIAKYSKKFPGTFRTLGWSRDTEAHARWYASANKPGCNKAVLRHIQLILKSVKHGDRGILWPLFGQKKNHLMLAGASGLGLMTVRGPGYAYRDCKIEVISASKRILFDPKTGEPAEIMKGLELSRKYNSVDSKSRYARLKKEAKAKAKELATAPVGKREDEDLFA